MYMCASTCVGHSPAPLFPLPQNALRKQTLTLLLLQGNRSRRASKEPLNRSVSKAAALGTFVGGRLATQDSLANYVPQNVTPAIERMLQVALPLCPALRSCLMPLPMAPALCLLCCSCYSKFTMVCSLRFTAHETWVSQH